MKKEKIIKELNQLNNNLCINNYIYINSTNIWSIIDVIKKYKTAPSILITPYLINQSGQGVFELYYCEFNIELHEINERIVKKFNVDNNLPEEINAMINPGIVINKNDYEFSIEQITNYLNAMNKINFSEEKKMDDRLESANLYYQIF
jgi:hypothetical protein